MGEVDLVQTVIFKQRERHVYHFDIVYHYINHESKLPICNSVTVGCILYNPKTTKTLYFFSDGIMIPSQDIINTATELAEKMEAMHSDE